MPLDMNMPTPPSGGMPVAKPPMNFTVPLKFLAQPDDSEAMQTPTKGDSVDAQVTLTVDDIQGENALCSATAINGQDLGGDSETPADGANMADEQEGSDLRSMALNA